MSHAETLPDLRPWPDPIEPTKAGYPCPDGVTRPRVTSVLNYFSDASENLYQWHEDQGKLVALEVVKKHLDWYRDLSVDQFLAKVEPEIKEIKAAKRAKDRAADAGTAAHKMIQWRIRGELGLPTGPEPKLSDMSTVAYMAFDDWWLSEKLKPVRTEQVLWDDDTAGQLDLICDGPEGLELIDFKVTNYVVPKHHVQLAKYLKMGRLWRDIRRARIVKLPKTLEKIEIEVKELGQVWDFKSRKLVTKTYEELLSSFDHAHGMFKVWA